MSYTSDVKEPRVNEMGNGYNNYARPAFCRWPALAHTAYSSSSGTSVLLPSSRPKRGRARLA